MTVKASFQYFKSYEYCLKITTEASFAYIGIKTYYIKNILIPSKKKKLQHKI